MYKWLLEALSSWLFPPPSCRREVGPSVPQSRKRRTQASPEDLDQEQAKRQKLGIVGTLTQGIASLIKLPSQLTTKYLQTGDQHAEATDENVSNVSRTLADKQMESTSGVQISKMGKKTNCCSNLNPAIEMVSDSHRVMTCLRHDQTYSVRKNVKKNHNAVREDLQSWGLVSCRHWLEGSTLDTGRYLRKPRCTVEEASAPTCNTYVSMYIYECPGSGMTVEYFSSSIHWKNYNLSTSSNNFWSSSSSLFLYANYYYTEQTAYGLVSGVQKEEREKYKQLLEQEKEKRSETIPSPVRAKYLDTQSYGHVSLTEINHASFGKPKNGVGSIGPLHSKTDVNSLMTVTERPSKSEKFLIQKKENIKQLLADDLSEEVSLRLRLSQEGISYRSCSLVESEEQKWQSVDKSTAGLPALTEDMEREIANVLSHGEDDEILTSAFKLNITRGDIQTLKNQQWLNDVVINFYMNLLVERNKKPGFADLYAFSTFFYPKLNSAGYCAVRRWTKGVDLFQYDMILVPIHISVHWALVVIDMRRETIKYFDSMGQNGDRICMKLLQYLQEESKAKRNVGINPTSWTLYSVKPHEIPQQSNGSDCGMFACKYADFISRDKPIVFTQCHMPYYRKRMVWEILHQQIQCLLWPLLQRWRYAEIFLRTVLNSEVLSKGLNHG
uniref:Sentrin-specific protease 2 n=1 Tax=Pogona vitticeps TaxID=103695 RepID=A0ABM5FVE7_9SAUR